MQDTSTSVQGDIYLWQSMNRCQNTQQVPIHSHNHNQRPSKSPNLETRSMKQGTLKERELRLRTTDIKLDKTSQQDKEARQNTGAHIWRTCQ